MPAGASWNRPTSVSSFATPQHASRRQGIGTHAAWFHARTLAQRISIARSCHIAEARGREVLPISDPLRPRSAKKLRRPMIALLSCQEGNAGSGSARKGLGEPLASSCRMAVARRCVKIPGRPQAEDRHRRHRKQRPRAAIAAAVTHNSKFHHRIGPPTSLGERLAHLGKLRASYVRKGTAGVDMGGAGRV